MRTRDDPNSYLTPQLFRTRVIQVCVEVRDLSNGNLYLWERNKFLQRQSIMNDVYQSYEETGAVQQGSKV